MCRIGSDPLIAPPISRCHPERAKRVEGSRPRRRVRLSCPLLYTRPAPSRSFVGSPRLRKTTRFHPRVGADHWSAVPSLPRARGGPGKRADEQCSSLRLLRPTVGAAVLGSPRMVRQDREKSRATSQIAGCEFAQDLSEIGKPRTGRRGRRPLQGRFDAGGHETCPQEKERRIQSVSPKTTLASSRASQRWPTESAAHCRSVPAKETSVSTTQP